MLWRAFFLILLLLPSIHAQMVQRSFVAFDYEYFEASPNQTNVVLSFTASQQNEYDIVVSYQTIDDTAIAGRDYIATQGEITFPAGSTNRAATIEIPLLQHELTEDRSFRVELDSFFPAEVSRVRGEIPVIITGLPALAIYRNQTNIVLQWRASATNFQLQSCSIHEQNWTSLTNTPITVNSAPPRYSLTLPATTGSRLFRLQKTGNLLP